MSNMVYNNANGENPSYLQGNTVLRFDEVTMSKFRDLTGEKLGINIHTLYARLVTNKWSVERALTEPVK